MDIETLKFGFQVLQFVATGAIGIYVYISNKNRVTNDRITTLESDIDSRLDGQGIRIAKVEEALNHTPTHSDLGALHDRITSVGKGVDFLAGEFKGVKNVLNVIHQHLMNGTKK
ncbi:hypothetical protein EBAPG3_010470 [Nitrosospira lacus]|uniref:DUF2730 domain-containing protein n=1 Tax=Nitrosospira lacus TaxID=1288494 RepID=A0A1W6SQU6_9PROT|nr:hypothetical protein [Nitrosospira lacus]ARO88166.1 hypothetical protein EBAPG3_010470 [Nitrosospira lacus]